MGVRYVAELGRWGRIGCGGMIVSAALTLWWTVVLRTFLKKTF